MTFKRSRPLSYGLRQKQVIITNGIAQPSPLDRKSGPLDQQKKFVLAISSDDREYPTLDSKGEESSASDCVIALKMPLRGVYGYRVLEFAFTNRFFGVQTGLNDNLQVTFDTPPTGTNDDVKQGRIVLSEGYYEFYSDPKDYFNPQDIDPSRDLNDISYTDLTALTKYYPLDIRVELLRAANSAITRIVTDRKTDRLTIYWQTPISAKIDLIRTTAISTLGLKRDSEGKIWNGGFPPNVDGPANISIVSSLLNNNELLDPRGENDAFLTIPVNVQEGDKQIYSPQHPPMVNFNGQVSISRIPIRIIEPQSAKVVKSNNMEWSMLLECFSLEASPFY